MPRRLALAPLLAACALLTAVTTSPVAAEPGPLRPAAVSGGYHPTSPARILDTRAGVGAPAGKLAPGASLDLQVTGRPGVPTRGVSAVVLNLTATNPTSDGFLTVFPTGEARPDASNLNFEAGDSVPNLATVKLGSGGRVTVYNPLGSTDVLADVVGWYDDGTTSVAGARYNPLPPARILDTRRSAPLGAGARLDLRVTGAGGVPDHDVSAVAVNVTATNATEASYLTVGLGGSDLPDTSNVNFVPGRDVANLAIAEVDALSGTIRIGNHLGTVDVVVDVVGWYDASGTTGSVFRPVTPTRIYDLRQGAPMSSGDTILALLHGSGPVPPEATAVALNLTVTNQSAPGYLVAWSVDGARPGTSTINWQAHRTVANTVLLRHTLAYTGFYDAPVASGSIDFILDVTGYFVAGS
jgi:hypothetical protein